MTKKTNKCGNCGKTIPENKKFCDEKCLREHLNKKKKKTSNVFENGGKEFNIKLIKKAIEKKVIISVRPRRTHIVKGIPIGFNDTINRVWIDTGSQIESILLGEIGHYEFPKDLVMELIKESD